MLDHVRLKKKDFSKIFFLLLNIMTVQIVKPRQQLNGILQALLSFAIFCFASYAAVMFKTTEDETYKVKYN